MRPIARRVLSFAPFALASIAISSPVNAEDAVIFRPTEQPNVKTVCVNFVNGSAAHDNQLRQWIVGFWSGMNVGAMINGGRVDVGEDITPDGLLGEVKLYCQQHPSTDIPRATMETYMKFLKSGR